MANYQFFCDHCGFKRQTNGSDLGDLHEVKTTPIARGVPKLDPLAKPKTITFWGQPGMTVTGQIIPPTMKQQKKFKCPKCGYVIKAQKLEKPNEQADKPDGREAGPPGPQVS